MPYEAGTIINGTEPNDSGIADVGAIDSNNGGNLSGSNSDDVLNGKPDEPSTERIVRTTKSGRPDGRSLRRGRRNGESSGESTDAKKTVDLGSFSFNDLLVGCHAMLAGFLKVEELEIDKEEGKKLGDAIQTVLKQYDHQINPKVAAWMQLGMISASVYGPRYMAIRIRKTAELKPKIVEMPAHAEATEPPQPTERDASIQ